jgi:26S proteasome regulatory subunit N12
MVPRRRWPTAASSPERASSSSAQAGSTQAAAALLEQLKSSFAKEELDTCVKQLAQLKIAMLSFSSLPPATPAAPSSSQQQELLLARDILEHGALVSIKTVDISAFERHIAQVTLRRPLPP